MSSSLCSWIPSSQTGLVPSWLNTIEEQVSVLDSSSTWKQRMNIAMMSNVALPIFSMMDETLHVAATVIKAPCVVVQMTLGKLCGFADQVPDTLRAKEWLGHVQKVFQHALLIFASILNVPMELYYPGFTLGIARRIGFITIPTQNQTRTSSGQSPTESLTASMST